MAEGASPVSRVVVSLARVLGAIVRAPFRFVAWVYQPNARRRPGRGELQTHRHAAQLGMDTSRWTKDEQRLHDAEAVSRRTAHDAEAGPKDV